MLDYLLDYLQTVFLIISSLILYDLLKFTVKKVLNFNFRIRIEKK